MCQSHVKPLPELDGNPRGMSATRKRATHRCSSIGCLQPRYRSVVRAAEGHTRGELPGVGGRVCPSIVGSQAYSRAAGTAPALANSQAGRRCSYSLHAQHAFCPTDGQCYSGTSRAVSAKFRGTPFHTLNSELPTSGSNRLPARSAGTDGDSAVHRLP